MTSELQRFEKLYTSVICDVLDAHGYRQQILDNVIRPLTKEQKICGRAKTARAIPVDQIPEEPYRLEMQLVDEVQDGDVLVFECGNDNTNGMWGELLTAATKVRGGRGVLMDACTRDLWKIESMNFPVFGIGYHPADSKGRMDIVEINAPVNFGLVKVNPGDIVHGDVDGVCVIPGEISEQILLAAEEKMQGENIVRQELEKGVPASVVFEKYQIL